MEQSNSSKIYDAYLSNWKEKNSNVVKPTFVNQFGDGIKELSAAMVGHVDAKIEGKCLRPSSLIILTDGRAVERGYDSRGCDLYAVFPDFKSASDYTEPLSNNVYFDRW